MEQCKISVDKLVSLKEDSLWLSCLEDAGVDNWEGIGFAQDLHDQRKGKQVNES